MVYIYYPSERKNTSVMLDYVRNILILFCVGGRVHVKDSSWIDKSVISVYLADISEKGHTDGKLGAVWMPAYISCIKLLCWIKLGVWDTT